MIAGATQVGRLKHNLLAAAPELVVPAVIARGQPLRDWWIRSWDDLTVSSGSTISAPWRNWRNRLRRRPATRRRGAARERGFCRPRASARIPHSNGAADPGRIIAARRGTVTRMEGIRRSMRRGGPASDNDVACCPRRPVLEARHSPCAPRYPARWFRSAGNMECCGDDLFMRCHLEDDGLAREKVAGRLHRTETVAAIPP